MENMAYLIVKVHASVINQKEAVSLDYGYHYAVSSYFR